MKIICSLKILFTALLTVNAATISAQSISPALDSALQSSINSLRVTHQVKGITAAAYIPGQGIWQGVTGESHATVDIDSTMILNIGSITKTYVASEILKLIEAGLLSLDDSLGSILPAINFVDPNITIRQLLGHKSGLAEYLNTSWQNAMNADLYRIWYAPHALDTFLTAPTGIPGGAFDYCNTNYALLGMIIETLQADSLHHVLRNDFLSPLSLNNTYMEVFEQYTNTVPHNWSTPTLNPLLAVDSWYVPRIALSSSTEAAGGLFSTAADLARWGYNLYSGNVISSASLTDMLTFTPVSGGYFNGYGLGAMRFLGNGRTYWGHAGNFFGFAACMLYYPQDSICVAVLINQDVIGANIAKPLINTLLNNLSIGINEHRSDNMFSVYPNPATASFTIYDVRFTISEIEIYSFLGEKVFSQQETTNADASVSTFGHKPQTVDVSQLLPGIYFITVTDQAGNKVTRKVVKM